ncbi:related to Adenine deaminase [Saccharomycodes ludwigii]|uniref:Adenine deaminase n=1 Tax=Saccharomycodes ludwigii TaxID=36035 RepID=A0A376B1P3_9ASCO|nr:related to Adenine deaminase [Saccharomycodes ludwigii]
MNCKPSSSQYIKHELTPQMYNFLKELPKCEHHLHIEGTLEPELLFTLAKKNSVTLPNDFPRSIQELKSKYLTFTDLQSFLDLYYVGCNVLITEDDFYELAMDYFNKVSKQGLKHAEIFFDPQSHTSRGIDINTIYNGLNKACLEINEKQGITTKVIMCLLRHLPVDECLSTIDLASDLIRENKIHGLGLDSSEKPFPPELFKECYSKAAAVSANVNNNLRLTAHAGEEGGPDYVSNSLKHLNVERIDHGINSYKDDLLMNELSSRKILLTVCPLSNVRLKVVKDVGELPLDTTTQLYILDLVGPCKNGV